MNIVKLIPEAYAQTHSSESFYKAVGLHTLFVQGVIKDVSQMRINTKTYLDISKLLQSNWKKEKQVRHLKAENAKRMIAFDWMNYSPVCDDKIPENEIWWIHENESFPTKSTIESLNLLLKE